MSKKTNRFKIEVPVHLPEYGIDNLHRWFNYENMGMELIPLDVKIPQKVSDSAWRLHRGRIVELEFQIDKKGYWKLINSKLA